MDDVVADDEAAIPRLTRPHFAAQKQWMDEARRTLASVLFVDEASVANRAVIRPCEGEAVDAEDGQWLRDAFGTGRMNHDVWPERELPHSECVPSAVHRRIASRVEEELRDAGLWQRMLQPNGGRMGAPLREQLRVAGDTMTIDVVNVVHTSYCNARSQEHVAPDDDDDDDLINEAAEELMDLRRRTARNRAGNTGTKAGDMRRETRLTHNWMWRRLMHLGCQQNHVHTSIKICMAPPFNASHLVFQTGRILETGASNLSVARIMLEHVTLAHIQAAGARTLHLQRRVAQNMVATSRMPFGEGLLLPLLQWRESYVEYRPRKFAGAVISHPSLHKIMILAFSGGAVVCVGAKSLESIRDAYATVFPVLHASIDSPENRAIAAYAVPAPAPVPPQQQPAPPQQQQPQQQQRQRRQRQERVLGACI